MVEHCFGKEVSCKNAEIFDLSSFEDVIKNYRICVLKKYNMLITKWLVVEKLAKNSSL